MKKISPWLLLLVAGWFFSNVIFSRYTIRAEELLTAAVTSDTFTIVGILETDDPLQNPYNANLKLKDEGKNQYFYFSSSAMDNYIGKRVQFTLKGDIKNYEVVERKLLPATTTTTSSTDCPYGGQNYKLHATFWASDNCNTCVCLGGQNIVCTQKQCGTSTTSTTTKTTTKTTTADTKLSANALSEKYCTGPWDMIFVTKSYIKVMSYINGYGATYYKNSGEIISCPDSNDTPQCQALAKLPIQSKVNCRDFVNTKELKESDIDALADLSTINSKLFYTIRYFLPQGFDIYALIKNGAMSSDNIWKIKDNVYCQQQVQACQTSCSAKNAFCDVNYCERLRYGCLDERSEIRNPRPTVWTREMMLAQRNKPKTTTTTTASGSTVDTNVLTEDTKAKVTDFLGKYFTAITKKQYTDLKQNYWCNVDEQDIHDVCVRSNTSRTVEQIWSTCAANDVSNYKITEIKKVGQAILATVEFSNIYLMNEDTPVKRILYILPKGDSYCTNNWYLFQWNMLIKSLR